MKQASLIGIECSKIVIKTNSEKISNENDAIIYNDSN